MRIDLFATQREELRSRLSEATAARWSASEVTRWLNLGAEEFQRRAKIITRQHSYSTVAAQQRYTLPQDYMDALSVWFSMGITHTSLDEKKIPEFLSWTFQSGNPQYHAVNESPRESWLYPVPSASAQTTTLNGSLSATATTVTVASTTSFPSRGRFLVDSEVIYYTGVTATTFTGCTRGSEDTLAASHSSAVTVTHRDIEFNYYPLPRPKFTVYTTGTVAITYATTAVTGTSTLWAVPTVKAGMYLGIGSMGSMGVATSNFPNLWYQIASIDGTGTITLAEPFLEATVTTASYIITELVDIPRRYCGAVVEIAMLFSQMKDENLKEIPIWSNRIQAVVNEAIGDAGLPPGYLPVSRDNTTRMALPQYPSNWPARQP